jgi:23S rRNA pseudouridine2605 synthase
MPNMRIQRLLADAGLASRRFAEQMILDGRVTVNGKLVIELPCFVDPDRDDIRLDNQPVRKKPARKINLLLNKPRGVECTRITTGRPGVFDVVPPIRGQAFCVAPLDQDSTGLVIITNDGQLRQLLTHHRYAIERTYVVEVDGAPSPDALDALHKGIYLDGTRTRPASVVILGRNAARTMLGIKIAETHNRELRRILVKLGHKVRRLKRSAIGTITDKGLKIGHFRNLTDHELQNLERQSTAPQRPPTVSEGAPQRAPSVSDGAFPQRAGATAALSAAVFPRHRNISDKRAHSEARQRAGSVQSKIRMDDGALGERSPGARSKIRTDDGATARSNVPPPRFYRKHGRRIYPKTSQAEGTPKLAGNRGDAPPRPKRPKKGTRPPRKSGPPNGKRR